MAYCKYQTEMPEIADMPTPQLAAGAPDTYCPKCGRRMQLLNTNESMYSYVCYGHWVGNAGTSEPYYLNVPYGSLGNDGRIKEAEGKPKERPVNYDPRLSRRSG